MAIDLSQYDYDVVTSCEAILRANLPTTITAINAELAGQIVVGTPANAQLAARSDAKLDERSMPQSMMGVWVRIVDTREILGVGGVPAFGGQSRTVHKLEVLTYASVQVEEASSATPTTQTTGYKTVLLLARAATTSLTDNFKCVGGVYNMLRVGGNRIEGPLKGLTYIHQIRDYFDVYQTTRR